MTVATSEAPTASDGDAFWLLATVSVITSLIMLDSNIVAVSLPAIGRALQASYTDVQWVIGAYVLTYAALLMASGAFADLYGRRLAMVIGLAIFGVSSLACGFATSAAMLNLSRAAQGVGGALLLTASLAILTHRFSGTERTRAFSFWGASIGTAMAGGPILGGIITNYFGWRWVFLLNVPLCTILIFGTFKTVEESRDPDARRIDLAGVATLSSSLVLLIWALIDGNDAGWSSASILSRLVGAFVLFGLFLFAETRQRRPMVDFALFRRSTFLGSVFAMVGYGAGAQVMIFFLPTFLQSTYGFAPLAAGLAMIPFALPMVMAPKFTTKLSAHFSGRTLLTTGLGVVGVGNIAFWLMARAQVDYAAFAAAMLVAGCGAGVLNGLTVKTLQAAVPVERAGMASGLASTTRYIGILVSVAGLGAVLSDVARSRFVSAAETAGMKPDAAANTARSVIAGDIDAVARAAPAGTADALHAAGVNALSNGFAATGLVAAFVAAIACVLTYRYVRTEDTLPSAEKKDHPCRSIDCRDPV